MKNNITCGGEGCNERSDKDFIVPGGITGGKPVHIPICEKCYEKFLKEGKFVIKNNIEFIKSFG